MVNKSAQKFIVTFGDKDGNTIKSRDESYLTLEDALVRALDIVHDVSKYAPLLNYNIETVSVVEMNQFSLNAEPTCTHNLFQWNDDTGEWEDKICQ